MVVSSGWGKGMGSYLVGADVRSVGPENFRVVICGTVGF